jgi:hypothetical protein
LLIRTRAQVARQHAVTALELDPGSDLAQHLMGRWHWEMAQLSSVVRFLARAPPAARPCRPVMRVL